MGYSTILDILGSIIMGGLLMLILWRMNASATDNNFNYGAEVALQQNLTTVALILEHDFRKIGYCKDYNKIFDPSKSILYADSTSIKFLTDDKDNGNLDTMYYYLGPTSELTSTPNPRDRLLHRVINGQTHLEANLGVTKFRLVYFGALGDTLTLPIAHPGSISLIEIDLAVENPYAYNNEYSQAFWRQIRLAARNLKNR